MKKSAKNTPTQIKNDLCVKSDDGKTQTSPDATGNASNFETFENPMSPQSAAMISNRHQDLYPKRKTILSHRSESMNMNHEIEQAQERNNQIPSKQSKGDNRPTDLKTWGVAEDHSGGLDVMVKIEKHQQQLAMEQQVVKEERNLANEPNYSV